MPGVKIVLGDRQRPGADALLLPHRRIEWRRQGQRLPEIRRDASGNGNGLLKSASYLMHSGNFTQVRDFVLQHSQSDRAGRLRNSARRVQAGRVGPSIRSAPISGRSRSSPAAVSRGSASCSRRPRRRRSTSASAIATAATTSNLLLAVRKEPLKQLAAGHPVRSAAGDPGYAGSATICSAAARPRSRRQDAGTGRKRNRRRRAVAASCINAQNGRTHSRSHVTVERHERVAVHSVPALLRPCIGRR